MPKKTYIRIYCNDMKMHSTGGEKWYRDYVLARLGLADFNEKLSLNEQDMCIFNNMIKYVENVRIKMHDNSIPEFRFKVEYIRSNNSGKHIIKTVESPYTIRYIEGKKASFLQLIHNNIVIVEKIEKIYL